MRKPAKTLDLAPAMNQDMLISVGKFADEEVNIYDKLKAKLKISKEVLIKCWHDPVMGLYHIQLKDRVENWNTDTVPLDKARNEEILVEMPPAMEAINNVCELPSMEKAIQYLHAAAGFPPMLHYLAYDNCS